jgi:hypothetical protein
MHADSKPEQFASPLIPALSKGDLCVIPSPLRGRVGERVKND